MADPVWKRILSLFASVAKRLGLKSKSFGKGEDRFLTISRKTDGRGLLRELLARGGQSEKYELLPPQMI